jgi:hypothetical protein
MVAHPADSAAAGQALNAAPAAPEEVRPESAAVAAEIPEPAESAASIGNPIVVDGLEIREITESSYQGRLGFRVVQVLQSGELFIMESYRDTTISGTGRVTVLQTPTDTIVGIVRLQGYEVIASCVMPEDSLRSLMSRLVEGVRPPNP